MATHDYVIANGTGQAVRSDINNALAAIVSNNSSSSEPGTTYAYQWWADTNANVLKLRNSSNDAWITLRELDGTMLIEDGSNSAPGLAFADDTNTGIYRPAADQIGFATAGVQRLVIETGEVVVNDPSNDFDFRVESNGNTHMLFVEGGTDRVGIGVSAPKKDLHVDNTVLLTGSAPQVRLSTDANDASDDNRAMFGLCTSDGNFFGSSATGDTVIRTTNGGDILFGEGTTETARLDSSGNLGIGTQSPSVLLHVNESTGDHANLILENSEGSAKLGTNSDIFYVESSQHIFYNSGGSTEYARVDSSGRLGLGTSNPGGYNASADEFVIANSGNCGLTIHSTSGNSSSIHFADAESTGSGSYAGYIAYTHTEDRMVFGTSALERVRIDSSGNTFINRTSQRSAEKFSVDNSGQVAIFTCTANADHSNIQMIHAYAQSSQLATQIAFQNHTATTVGSIKSGVSATSYNTSSDYRLKENVVDLDGAITRVKELSPKRFNFIVNPDTTVDGFLAHEAQTVVPEAVHGTHNEVDDDGNPVYQGIDQSKLIPLLTAALQEAIAKIETLETKVAALEAS